VAGPATVSSIHVWYETDFGGTERRVIEHLKEYARPDLAAALAGIDRISDDHHDWMLDGLRQ
jgi:hypothetical protein